LARQSRGAHSSSLSAHTLAFSCLQSIIHDTSRYRKIISSNMRRRASITKIYSTTSSAVVGAVGAMSRMMGRRNSAHGSTNVRDLASASHVRTAGKQHTHTHTHTHTHARTRARAHTHTHIPCLFTNTAHTPPMLPYVCTMPRV
jgi:hypothetical protein